MVPITEWHSVTIWLSTIWLPDMSDNRMPTVESWGFLVLTSSQDAWLLCHFVCCLEIDERVLGIRMERAVPWYMGGSFKYSVSLLTDKASKITWNLYK